MDSLYHRTNSMLEDVHQIFVRLERTSPQECHVIENEIQARLDAAYQNVSKLEILANKELPQRRTAARVQVDQLKYDCNHYQASLRNFIHRRLIREQEHREREELLSRTFSTNDSDTTIMIDHSLVQNRSLQSAHKGMDELLGTGHNVLENLRDQRTTLKGAHKKILDIANYLGMSNTVMRLIEKRTYQDKFILIIGMAVTCVVMFLIYKYIA